MARRRTDASDSVSALAEHHLAAKSRTSELNGVCSHWFRTEGASTPICACLPISLEFSKFKQRKFALLGGLGARQPFLLCAFSPFWFKKLKLKIIIHFPQLKAT